MTNFCQNSPSLLTKRRKAVKILTQILTAFFLFIDYNTNMIVYLDIVFVENILMNYIIMYGTGLIQKIEMKNSRLSISSIIGAIYSIISYLEIIPIYSKFFMKVLLSVVMTYIAFNPHDVKKMLKSLVLFYLISFVTGGCAFALLYLISPQKVAMKNGVFVGSYPMKVTVIAGLVGFLLIQYSFSINKRKLNHKDLICDLNIKICGKLINTKAFVDSGNNLRDPLTGGPVVITHKSVISEVVDIDDLTRIKGGDSKIKIRLIPFKSIGKQNGMLMGIQSEYIEVKYDGEKSIIKNVIIGIYDRKISKHYSALVGLDLINGGNENEYNSNFKKDIFQYSKR